MRTIERHPTLAALALSICAPLSLGLTLFWNDWQGLSSTSVLVGLLISVFLFTTLRLILLPAFYGRATRFGWLAALVTALSTVGLAGVEGLTGHGGVGPAILLFSTAGSVLLFVLVETMARRG